MTLDWAVLQDLSILGGQNDFKIKMTQSSLSDYGTILSGRYLTKTKNLGDTMTDNPMP
jgi:chemotaxis protein CheY-P-specific phosphatase CheC